MGWWQNGCGAWCEGCFRRVFDGFPISVLDRMLHLRPRNRFEAGDVIYLTDGGLTRVRDGR